MRDCTLAERDAVAAFAHQLDGIKQRFAQVDRQRRDPWFDAAELPQAESTMSLDDWDVLFRAVRTRLRLTVTATQTQHLNGAAGSLQANVLECVDALDQLHAMLQPARAQQLGGR